MNQPRRARPASLLWLLALLACAHAPGALGADRLGACRGGECPDAPTDPTPDAPAPLIVNSSSAFGTTRVRGYRVVAAWTRAASPVAMAASSRPGVALIRGAWKVEPPRP